MNNLVIKCIEKLRFFQFRGNPELISHSTHPLNITQNVFKYLFNVFVLLLVWDPCVIFSNK